MGSCRVHTHDGRVLTSNLATDVMPPLSGHAPPQSRALSPENSAWIRSRSELLASSIVIMRFVAFADARINSPSFNWVTLFAWFCVCCTTVSNKSEIAGTPIVIPSSHQRGKRVAAPTIVHATKLRRNPIPTPTDPVQSENRNTNLLSVGLAVRDAEAACTPCALTGWSTAGGALAGRTTVGWSGP